MKLWEYPLWGIFFLYIVALGLVCAPIALVYLIVEWLDKIIVNHNS